MRVLWCIVVCLGEGRERRGEVGCGIITDFCYRRWIGFVCLTGGLGTLGRVHRDTASACSDGLRVLDSPVLGPKIGRWS